MSNEKNKCNCGCIPLIAEEEKACECGCIAEEAVKGKNTCDCVQQQEETQEP